MAASSRDALRIIAIGSGKGGAGKSLLAANLGIFLATLGKRVVLVDAAFGGPSLHAFVGMEIDRPERQGLDRVQQGDAIPDAVMPTPVPGLGLLSGSDAAGWSADRRDTVVSRLLEELRQLPVDFVVVDLAGGIGSSVLELFLGSDVGLLMVSPDPASVELGYRFIRAAFLRRLAQVGLGDRALFDDAAWRAFPGGVPAPVDIYRRAAGTDPALARRVESEMLALRPRLVVNNVRSKADMELGHALAAASRRRLGLPITNLGHLEYDDAAWVSLRRRRPLLIEHPESRAAKDIERLTRRLLARETERHFVSIAVGDTYYDLFDVEPTASEEDIRRANRRIRQIYARESVVVGGLYGPEDLEDLQRRFDEAYDTLMDPVQRKAYDHELFPDGPPMAAGAPETLDAAAAAAPPPEERPPFPDLAADTEYTGSLMRQVREARGLDLREISERTKIGTAYLSAIEDERFRKLPAAVYVRGFLVEYAKMLEIDVERVLETYLKRYREARDAPAPVEP